MKTRKRILIYLLLLLTLLSSCNHNSSITQSTNTATATSTSTTQIVLPVATGTSQRPKLSVWFNSPLPEDFLLQAEKLDPVLLSESEIEANVQITIDRSNPIIGHWIYVLVAPFPTITDDVSSIDLQAFWNGESGSKSVWKKLLVDSNTHDIFSNLWGQPADNKVIVLSSEQLLDRAWELLDYWAIIPFENLVPQWKVISVDGIDPLDREFASEKYPLSVPLSLSGDEESIQALEVGIMDNLIDLSFTNRDPDKMTRILMTGTTALTRDIADKMDEKGIHYPAQDIMDWFKSADIVHISHEVSYLDGCVHNDGGKFCARPEYIDLLKFIGTTVVELTGNHLLDFGELPFLDTLEVYRSNDILYFGGGDNIDDARTPVLLTDHGNKVAFLGM